MQRLVILLNSVWLGIDSTINRRALLFQAVGMLRGFFWRVKWWWVIYLQLRAANVHQIAVNKVQYLRFRYLKFLVKCELHGKSKIFFFVWGVLIQLNANVFVYLNFWLK